MKYIIFAVINRHDVTEVTLNALSDAGYNGTVIHSNSLRKTIASGGEVPMFVNLSNVDTQKFEGNTTIYIVTDEEKVDEIMGIIRKETDNWSLSDGGMFALPLSKYEGSF